MWFTIPTLCMLLKEITLQGKSFPPIQLHGPAFLQQPHASVIGNCFQEAGADRLGHTHGKAISTEQADYCNGFFLCKLLEYRRQGRNWWFGYFETILKTNSLSWDVPVVLGGYTDLPSWDLLMAPRWESKFSWAAEQGSCHLPAWLPGEVLLL